MKIVYISNSIIPSRTANSIHVMKMCQAFAANNHEVVLLAPLHKNNITSVNLYDYYGVKENFKVEFVSFLNIPKLWSLSYAINVYRHIRTINFDIAYGRDLKSCFLATKVCNNSKVVYEPHKPFEKHNVLDKHFLRLIITQKQFFKLIVISESLQKMYLSLNEFKKCKIEVAHDGSDTPESNETITNIIGKERLQVGYAGHLYQGRGIDIILKIAEKIDCMDFHIVGGNLPDIAYWKSKTTLHNIIFHGFVEPSKVYKYINSFDIVLAPYQNKVSIAGQDDSSAYMSPIKIFEYMASKKAIVVSDLSVLHEVLEHGKTALFVKHDNVNEWCEAIDRLKNIKYRNSLSKNANDEFIAKYSWLERAKNVLK